MTGVFTDLLQVCHWGIWVIHECYSPGCHLVTWVMHECYRCVTGLHGWYTNVTGVSLGYMGDTQMLQVCHWVTWVIHECYRCVTEVLQEISMNLSSTFQVLFWSFPSYFLAFFWILHRTFLILPQSNPGTLQVPSWYFYTSVPYFRRHFPSIFLVISG